MHTFHDIISQYSPEWITQQLAQTDQSLVLSALRRAEQFQTLSAEQLLALLSPTADAYLENMAQLSQHHTQQRFGKTIQMYVPLYLSNECLCTCTYCGFSRPNEIKRHTLSMTDIDQEAQYLYDQGFRHILLLSGEDARYVNVKLLKEVTLMLKDRFSAIAIEVQPLKCEEYQELVECGIDGVTVYQETYDRDVYSQVHLGGPKKRYDYRLATPERAAEAGIRRLGIGALLGLTPWRVEAFYVGLHAQYLERHFWRTHVSVSFPRLREATGFKEAVSPIKDREFVQLLMAMRLFLPNAGIVLSTREKSEFRDAVMSLGVTQMSAGSRTTPGGYIEDNDSGAQFEVEDQRTPAAVAAMIQAKGYEPVWKDWDPLF